MHSMVSYGQAPWTCLAIWKAAAIAWEITEQGLEANMQVLRAAGYQGCWSVEHHTGQHEYTEVSIQLAKVRDVLSRWELERVTEREGV